MAVCLGHTPSLLFFGFFPSGMRPFWVAVALRATGLVALSNEIDNNNEIDSKMQLLKLRPL
jgi:hypothetical protein